MIRNKELWNKVKDLKYSRANVSRLKRNLANKGITEQEYWIVLGRWTRNNAQQAKEAEEDGNLASEARKVFD